MHLQQYHVAVFSGDRAKDLVAVFGALAATDGEAYQQAWNYIRDHSATSSAVIDPARLEYHAVVTPAMPHPRRENA